MCFSVSGTMAAESTSAAQDSQPINIKSTLLFQWLVKVAETSPETVQSLSQCLSLNWQTFRHCLRHLGFHDEQRNTHWLTTYGQSPTNTAVNCLMTSALSSMGAICYIIWPGAEAQPTIKLSTATSSLLSATMAHRQSSFLMDTSVVLPPKTQLIFAK